jgi:hypothetical protein
MSLKTTVTVLRYSGEAPLAVSGAPQFAQNREFGVFSTPHRGQVGIAAV